MRTLLLTQMVVSVRSTLLWPRTLSTRMAPKLDFETSANQSSIGHHTSFTHTVVSDSSMPLCPRPHAHTLP
eukprot:1160599-Pelagomonas_calceolata.AAC.17